LVGCPDNVASASHALLLCFKQRSESERTAIIS
jgi:hypothetical protein